MENKRGFTLIELMVVLAIIGVLATVAVFVIGGLVKESKLKADLATIYSIERAEAIYYTHTGQHSFDEGVAQTESNFNLSLDHLKSYISGVSFKIIEDVHWEIENNHWKIVYSISDGSDDPPDYPEWDSSVSNYDEGDYVIYDGRVFYARTWVAGDVTPGQDGAAWQEVTDEWRSFNVYDEAGIEVVYNGATYVSRGWSTNQIPGEMGSAWNEVTDEWRDFNVYDEAGIEVVYNGSTYVSRGWTSNQTPGLMSSPWNEVTDEWRSFNIYNTGDVVTYNGKSYRAKWWSQNTTPDLLTSWEEI